MNNTQFSNSFKFREYRFEKYRYTDRRIGAEYHFVACMRKGSCRIVTKEQTLEVKEGEVFYIPKNLPYQSYWFGEPVISFASYGFHFFPNQEEHVFPLQKIRADAEDLALIDQVIHGNESCSGAIFRFYGLLSRLLPKMVYISQDSGRQLLSRAEQLLRENPFLRMGELAKACGVSESGLYTAFKRQSTDTPNVLRQKMLLERAVQMLEETDLSVEEISSALRFSSASYFRKVLKQHTGLTPRQIRKRSSI